MNLPRLASNREIRRMKSGPQPQECQAAADYFRAQAEMATNPTIKKHYENQAISWQRVATRERERAA